MENTKVLKRFSYRDDASKYAKNVNEILSDIGESLDKFAFTERDKETSEYMVKMIFGQNSGLED